MNSKFTGMASLFQRAKAGANALTGILFFLMFVLFIIQVIARFIFNKPLSWTDELAVILYIWVVLLGAVLACREREHVSFDLLYGVMPPFLKRMMRLVGCFLIGGLLLAALPESWSYVQFMAREKTAVLGYSMRVVYFPFLIFLVFVVMRQIYGIFRLTSSRWESEL